MVPAWRLLPTWRRLATTAWFVAFMTFALHSGLLLEGRGVGLGAALRWLAPMAIIGYLLSPVWEVAARAGRWRSFRDRAWKTAASMAAGLAAALAVDALVRGGLGAETVLRAVVKLGGMFLFIMVMPRIATGRWR